MKLVALAPLPAALEEALRILDGGGIDCETLAEGASPAPAELAASCDALLAEATTARPLLEGIRGSEDASTLPVAVFGSGEPAGADALRAGADLWLDAREGPELLAARVAALCRRAALGGSPRLDRLTGLLGRAMFTKLLRHELDRAKRYKRPMAVLAIEPDDAAARGDAALLDVAASLRSSIRDVDLLARLGPARFAVLLPETDANGALKAAERLKAAAASGRRATVSIGVAGFPSRGMEAPEHVLGRSLESLVQALRLGGDRIVPFGAPDVVWSRHPPDPARL